MKSRIFFSLILLMVFFFGCNKDTTKTPEETGEKVDRIVLKVAHNGPEKHPFQKGYEKFKEVLEAVIDKDLSACCLAIDIKANILLILTDTDRVALNSNAPKQKWIDRMSLAEAKRYLTEEHFEEGSMKPKIEAGIRFLENGGETSVIASLFSASTAVQGISGTAITK